MSNTLTQKNFIRTTPNLGSIRFEVDYASTKYIVIVTKTTPYAYAVNVPNFGFGIETTAFPNIGYRLVQSGISKADADNIERILKFVQSNFGI